MHYRSIFCVIHVLKYIYFKREKSLLVYLITWKLHGFNEKLQHENYMIAESVLVHTAGMSSVLNRHRQSTFACAENLKEDNEKASDKSSFRFHLCHLREFNFYLSLNIWNRN